MKKESTAVFIRHVSADMGEETEKLLSRSGYTEYGTARLIEKMSEIKNLGVETLKMDVPDEESMITCIQEFIAAFDSIVRALKIQNMKGTKTILLVLLFFTSGFQVIGQAVGTGTIKGRVVDKFTKQSIPGATVAIKNTSLGTATDTLGNFTLGNINVGIYSIVISFIGYQEKPVTDVTVAAGKTSYIEIEIEEAASTLNEVHVTASRHENNSLTPVSAYSFSREEISTNPGSQGDIFRALSMMPGVAANGAEYSAIAVRGQGTRENVFMVDNIPVSQLSHFDQNVRGSGFNDPNGGRYSIFAPRIIDQAEYIGGGFPAQYGRRSASYLGLKIREGNREDHTIDGQLDLLGINVNYDGPSYIDKNTSLFVSARYQNFGPLTELVNQPEGGLAIFGDYIFKSVTQLDAKNKLTLLAIHSPETYTHDLENIKADTALNNPLLMDFTNRKNIFGATLQTLTSKKSYWKNVLYFTKTKMENIYGHTYPKIDHEGKLINEENLPYENNVQQITYSEQEIGFRSIFSQHLGNRSLVTAGIDVSRIDLKNSRSLSRPDTSYIFGVGYPQLGVGKYYSVFSPQDFNAQYDGFDTNASAYIDYSFLVKSFTINAGIRYDYSGFSDQHTVSPRVSGSFDWNETNSINFAAGVYYQDPVYSEIADQPSGNPLEEEQIQQYIIGYKRYFSPDLKLTIEGWYKHFDKLVVRPVNGSRAQNNDGTGWAQGADIYLRQRLSKRFHWQIGYSYMLSKRNDNNGLGDYNFDFSEPHQISLLLAYQDNKRWVLSTKFKYATGRPTGSYIIHSNIFNDPDFIRYSKELTGKNNERLPDFVELDVRVDYRFQLRKLRFTAFLDIANINNRLNPNQAFFNQIKGRGFYDGLEIFPTFGLKFSY